MNKLNSILTLISLKGPLLILKICLLTFLFSSEINNYNGTEEHFGAGPVEGNIRGLGQYGYPSDPAADRAKGYLLKGKIKNAITNYGNFITWDHHPAGLWGDYAYLPHVAMVAALPGHQYSSLYQDWVEVEMQTHYPDWDVDGVAIWCSDSLYDEWNLNTELLNDFSSDSLTIRVNGKYVGVVFETHDDRGTVGQRKVSLSDITGVNQWAFDFTPIGSESGDSRVCIAIRSDGLAPDPRLSNAMIGIMYPWGLRPALDERKDEFDLYIYGPDGDDWTEDDTYAYYGATSQESWFTRVSLSPNADWHPTWEARMNSHGTEYAAGDIFGGTIFSDAGNSYPLLAHSAYSQTWPSRFDEESGEFISYWPGWYALDFDEDLPGCDGDRDNDACWAEVPGRFISDSDVYMEFDDRWAHRGNMVDSNNEYLQTGYPLGIQVKSTAHSYGVSFAEDIMFVTVWVYNKSNEMVMPDGTKLNSADGFNYEEMTLGFYMDADVLSTDIFGNFSVHTNEDDFMEYVDCKTSDEYYPDGCPVVNGKELRVSIATIGDWDGISNAAMGHSMDPDAPAMGNDFGLVAVQMLDSPRATEDVDLDLDGFVDIYVGEKLKMTDWHWFDWYNRPGVVYSEGASGCCAGDAGKPQALNKEEIQYKVMSGDTTNLTDAEKVRYFHADPALDDADPNFNPHFDNVEDLKDTEFFLEDPPGLDCVMEMTCGPFDLAVQDSVPFSFCIIYGQNMEDLLANAEFAQVMYNAKYQGFTSPSIPDVKTDVGDRFVKIYWDQDADFSKDVVTGYYDFEGYKIYKSLDGGLSWGDDSGKIFDNTGVQVGWRPIKQFDLNFEDDYYHCVKSPQIGNCEDIALSSGQNDTKRGMSVSGVDPIAPWFYLGEDSGMPDQVDELYCGNYYNSSKQDSLPRCGVDCETFMDDHGHDYECHYYYVDTEVNNGVEYTYSIASYDMGLPDSTQVTANPDLWARPNGYQLIESSRGSTALDKNLVTAIPGSENRGIDCESVRVIPNPYIVYSGLNETEYMRRISFTDLPELYDLKIYTINGELVWSQDEGHQDAGDGVTFWNLRTVNNQEVSPGLYIYTVDAMTESGNIRSSVCNYIGKLVIVR